VGLAWFSPDCKHFSKAKGGKPVKKKIRGLAWVVIRWAKRVRPRVIILENVEEFQTWGPLTADNMPCPKRKGQTFRSWKSQLQKLGYAVEHREMRACDFGAPTIRKRFFLIARCDGQPIVWPEATHGKPTSDGVKAGKLQPWRTAAECIDWSIPCPSIFERSKPLAEATLRRIAAGIKRYVIDAAEPFIVEYHSPKHPGDERVRSTDGPLPTQTTENRFGLVTPFVASTSNTGTTGRGKYAWEAEEPLRTVTSSNGFTVVTPHITKFRTGSVGSDIAEPMPTVTANSFIKRPGGAAPIGLVGATLVQTGYGERDGQAPRVPGLDKPLGTTVATGKHAVVAAFMAQHNGVPNGGVNAGHPAADPLSTITAAGSNQQVVTACLAGVGGRAGQSRPRGLDEPTATITSKADGAVVAAHLTSLYGTNKDGRPVDAPAPTATAGGNHTGLVAALMVKYYGNEFGGVPVTDPLHTVTSKERMGLVTCTVQGQEYVITDIGMRMLSPRELARAQGFPDSYILTGTKTNQVARIGNSVCPVMAQVLVAANYSEQTVRVA